MPPDLTRGHLPRLAPQWYCGAATVFWTHTIANRATGWLGGEFHAAFRETMLHTAAREHLLCPIYTLMPDHVHLIWLGVSAESDQLNASAFLRRTLERRLAPHEWQRQAHDHVLRDEERARDSFVKACHYIAENPVRAGLIKAAADWPYSGCVVPGYPDLHPLREYFWEKFWRFHRAALERGRTGKL